VIAAVFAAGGCLDVRGTGLQDPAPGQEQGQQQQQPVASPVKALTPRLALGSH
jgi:hypothetical protein